MRSASTTSRSLQHALLLAATLSVGSARLTVAQTAVAAIPELQARVTGLRYFAVNGIAPGRGARVYGNRFDAQATRYINTEIELAFAAPGRVVEFAIVCHYTKPDGARLGPIDMKFVIQPDWVYANHQNGWGAANPGFYAPGTYRVSCTAGEETVAEGSFEVVSRGPEIPELEGKLVSWRFFASPKDTPAFAQRSYAQQFTAADLRYIGVELMFAFDPPGRVVEFRVQCTVYKPDGTKLGEIPIRYAPQAEWKSVENAGILGWENPGNWGKGVHRVVCAAGDTRLGDSLFEIV